MYSASVRCVCFGEYWSESFTTKRMSFSFLSLLLDFFCHEYLLALEVVLGLAFFYNRCMSLDRVKEKKKKRVSRSSQMNLCKWLFDNEASLICQLCLYKQTLPCKASQSLESADLTEEIKRVFFLFFVYFSLSNGTRVWLRSSELSAKNKKTKLPVRAVASLIQSCEV